MVLRTLCFCAVLIVLTGCGETEHHIELCLQDGTHTSGLLLSVEDEWIVIDRNETTPEPDIFLVDKSLVDTAVVPGEISDLRRGVMIGVGALAGGIGGYWAGEGYLPDSTRPANPKRSTSATVGALAGVAIGSALGLLASDIFKPGDVMFVNPDEEQYDSIRAYAKYPTGLPADLREALDSGWEWRVDR